MVLQVVFVLPCEGRAVQILEKEHEKKVKTACKNMRIIDIKIARTGERGYPDREYCLPNGMTVRIEHKRKGERPNPIQLYRMSQLRERGHYVGWTDDPATAIAAIITVLVPPRIPDEGDEASAVARRRRAFLGSWFGENFDLSCLIQHLEAEGYSFQDAANRASTAYVQGVAR